MSKKELVKDYLERIKLENSSHGRIVEIRPNFFYFPRLNEMLLMHKQVTVRAEVSNIYLYFMQKKDSISNVNLSKMSPIERKDFFLNHLNDYFIYSEDEIAHMANYIDPYNYNNTPNVKANKLSILEVDKDFRGKGLAKELITELKSDTINNGISEITARMAPLDTYNVSLDDLAVIYRHLGFNVNYGYMKDKNIKMLVNENSLPSKLAYPKEYTDYRFQNNPPILIR